MGQALPGMTGVAPESPESDALCQGPAPHRYLGHPLPHPQVLRWLVWEVRREGPDEPLALGLAPCWAPGARTAPWSGQGQALLSGTWRDTARRHSPTERLSTWASDSWVSSPCPLLPPPPCRNPGAGSWTPLAEPASLPPLPLPPRASSLHPALLGPAPGAVCLPAQPGPLMGSTPLDPSAPATVQRDLEPCNSCFPHSLPQALPTLWLAPPHSLLVLPVTHPQRLATWANHCFLEPSPLDAGASSTLWSLTQDSAPGSPHHQVFA